MTAPFSRATASTLCMNSWCSRCALLTSATRRRGQRAPAAAISPGWFMPSSTHARRGARAFRRSSVSGTPMWLFRLPAVASAASPSQARRMAAIICVTVVLPLLPVTAISGRLEAGAPGRAPAAAARAACRPPAARAGRLAATPRSASAAAAPAARACGRKSWASKRSPRSATNRSPGCSVRVSLCTRCTRVRRVADAARAPGSRAWAVASVIMPAAPAQAPRCASSASEKGWLHAGALPGSPRGPCRRSAPRRPAPPRAALARWRRGGRRRAPRRGRCRPATICARMASGASSRGLSLVSTTWSAPRSAMRAHQRRACWRRGCRRSRTRTTARPPRAAASGRSDGSTLSSASGVCA